MYSARRVNSRARTPRHCVRGRPHDVAAQTMHGAPPHRDCASFMVGALLAGAARLMSNEPGGADARPHAAQTSRDSQSKADAASPARNTQRAVATSGATVTPPVADAVSTASATAAPLQPSSSSREPPAVAESASQPAAASTEDPPPSLHRSRRPRQHRRATRTSMPVVSGAPTRPTRPHLERTAPRCSSTPRCADASSALAMAPSARGR